MQTETPPGAGAPASPEATPDPFPRWAGAFVGISALVFFIAVSVTFWALNPAFHDGRAGGTANQIGQAAPGAGGGGAEPAPGSPEAEGKQLIGAKGCGGCHVIPGLASAKGTVGPSLAGVAGRKTIAGGAVTVNGPDDLKKWIENPPALKPGTAMPNLGVSDADATKIVAYLETLK